MKRIICIFVFIFSQSIFSQEIEYLYKNIDATLKFKLLINPQSNLSQWKMVENAKGEKVENDNINRFFIKKDDGFYFSDKVFSKRILVKDNLDLQWTKTSETEQILGYTCNIATANFRGRNYKAYYTTDIPHNAGPWKFSRLDGLILKVHSEDGLYDFTALNIILDKPNIDLQFINKTIADNQFIEWNEFVEVYKNEVDNFIKDNTCNCSEDGKNILKITKMEKIYPQLHDSGIVY